MVWGGIAYHSRTPLVRIADTLNSQRYISEVLEPVILPYLQGLATAIFQQDNARPPVECIVQRFFVNHQIELLPWPAHSPDLSPIEIMWPIVAQRLTQITPPTATPDQLWQRVEAAWTTVPQEHIQSLLESMPKVIVVFIDESRICLQHHDGRFRVWRHRGERMLNSCVMHRHTGPALGIMVWDGIGYPFRTPLIELLPWLALSPDLSPIENMWSMVSQRLTQITPPAATPDQLWQHVEAAWSAVLQEHIQSLFESMPRRVAAVISNNGGYSGY
ncbi:transposable element Tcb1 transposase [Trichonephila clavipes]|uniref:Transposable element Tcb1 transposase n=1 Tax=Trichonephila clavipes TaxID=2585209 RepID=A0A8X6RYL5_TRICX|nr:transposable element Tcb1 transposase [Trichonephila clavipes]